MTHPPVLLVEDNTNDEALMLRAFKKGGFINEVVVARTALRPSRISSRLTMPAGYARRSSCST